MHTSVRNWWKRFNLVNIYIYMLQCTLHRWIRNAFDAKTESIYILRCWQSDDGQIWEPIAVTCAPSTSILIRGDRNDCQQTKSSNHLVWLGWESVSITPRYAEHSIFDRCVDVGQRPHTYIVACLLLATHTTAGFREKTKPRCYCKLNILALHFRSMDSHELQLWMRFGQKPQRTQLFEEQYLCHQPAIQLVMENWEFMKFALCIHQIEISLFFFFATQQGTGDLP